jgi:hypothetical protein
VYYLDFAVMATELPLSGENAVLTASSAVLMTRFFKSVGGRVASAPRSVDLYVVVS